MSKQSENITRRIPKTEVQKMIKALRAAGLTVTKNQIGYFAVMIQHATKDGKRTGKTRELKLFTALNGSRDYLVTMRADLFQ